MLPRHRPSPNIYDPGVVVWDNCDEEHIENTDFFFDFEKIIRNDLPQFFLFIHDSRFLPYPML